MKQSVTIISITILVLVIMILIFFVENNNGKKENTKSQLSMISIDSPPGYKTVTIETLPNDSVISFVSRKFITQQGSKIGVLFKNKNQLYTLNSEEGKIIFLRIGTTGVILKTEWTGKTDERIKNGVVLNSFENENLGLSAGKTFNLYH